MTHIQLKPERPPVEPPDGVVTVVFTDIVGSTAVRDALVARLGEVDGDKAYRRILERAATRSAAASTMTGTL